MSKFLDKTGLDTLWAKIKSTFQTLGNLVTDWGSTPSDTKYPSEKLVKDALDGKIPGTTLSANIPASSTRYIKMTVTEEAFHHYIVMLNAMTGSDHAEWMFRTYGTGGNVGRTVVNYIGAPVTDRKWFVAGATGQTYYIEYANTATDAKPIKFSVCSIDNSALPTLEVVDTVPSGYGRVSIYGTAAERLINARKLAVNLANNSTDSTFSGAADQTSIKVSGTLRIANGGTGRTSVTSNSFLVGNGSSAMVEKTPAEVLALIGAQAPLTEMTEQEVTDTLNALT